MVIGLNLLSVSEQLNFDEDFKVKISDSWHNLKFEKISTCFDKETHLALVARLNSVT